MNRFSLRVRLIALLVTSLALVWAVTLVLSYLEAHDELDELFDARLEDSARALAALDLTQLHAATTNSASDDARDEDADDYGERVAYQAWSRDGRLLIRSHDAPAAAFVQDPGYRYIWAQGEAWRSFALWNERAGFQVRIFDEEDERREMTGEIIAQMGLPLAFSLPILLLLVWFSIGRGLAPLAQLSREVSSRGAENLTGIELARVPSEVEPLIASLNALLNRLAQSLDKERRFTADAAHELRTPLAAIRAQAEVALGSEDEAQRGDALRNIIEGVDRSTHLVQQLLTLARLDRPEALTTTPVDLARIVQQCAARYAEASLQKGLDLGVEVHGDCRIDGDAALLDVLCGNLIDNAIRYTQHGARVEATVRGGSDAVELRVDDSGPGIGNEDHARLTDRFFRVPGAEASGSGLGLSIVNQIVRLHRGEIALSPALEGRGLSAVVRFPRTSSNLGPAGDE